MAGECKGTFEDFLNALAQRESSNQPSILNGLGNAGLWQMGEDSLIDAGFYVRKGSLDTNNKNDWTGDWSPLAQSYGVSDITDFLNNPAAQRVAMQAFMEQVGTRYINKWESYVGQTIAFQDPRTGEYSSVTITESSLLAMYHLGGNSATTRFLRSGGAINPNDGRNGVIGTPVSEYASLFGGYDAPYGNNGSCSPPGNPIDPNDLDKLIKRLKNLLKNAQSRSSPLVLDLDGDGVETTNINNGAYFDHDASGFAESTGWVGADDGLLVLDRNSDGRISDGTELFGNQSLLPDGSKAENGFQALAQWDSNSDGRIDTNDAIWSQLQVWRDQNEDGYSQASELYSLSDFGILSLNTEYSNTSVFVDAQGNEHRQQGTFTRADGATGTVTDVWFQSDRTFTIPDQVVNVSADIAVMPNARGYGNVYDLRQAMARDSSGRLVGLVQQFSNQADPAQRAVTLDQILFAWTGSEGIDPTSRGAYFDARKLGVLEKFFGEPYEGWSGPNPTAVAEPELTQSYNGLAEMVYGQLMAQTHLRGLYDLITYQLTNSSGVTGDLAQVANVLYSSYVSSWITGETTFLEFVRTIKAIDGNNSINLDSLRINNTMSWLLDTYGQVRITGSDLDDSISGTASSEVIRGLAGNDTLTGGGGSDTLFGGDGNDSLTVSYGNSTLDGGAGDDILTVEASSFWDQASTLIGGTGDDRLVGSANSDIYVFNRGDGQDTIYDYDPGYGGWGSSDTIRFGTGIAQADLVVRRSGNHLVVTVNDPNNPAATDQITIEHWFETGSSNLGYFQIENFTFADGTGLTGDQVHAMALTLIGTVGDDTLDGWEENNTIYGLAGNDILNGNGGNDTLFGGDGNDSLTVSYGNSVLDGGAGDDTLTVQAAANWDQANTLIGGTGNDRLVGSVGSDTYVLNRGDGQDTIYDYDPGCGSWGGSDTIRFGVGIASLDLVLSRNSDDLVLATHGSTDLATIEGWYFGATNQIETIRASDGSTLLSAQVDQLIQAMATFSANNGGISWDQAIQDRPNDVQAILTAYWQPAA